MNYVKILWVWFWVKKMGRCPKCFRNFWCFGDYGVEYGYCRNHISEAYYENGDKVIFREG